MQLAVFGDGGDVGIRFQDLDVGIAFDVARAHFTGLVHPQVQRLRIVDVQFQRNLLEIEDDVGRVLDDSGDRRELVEHPVDLDRGDRGALDRREQHAADGIADRRAEPALERLRVEAAEPFGQGFALDLEPLGSLKAFPEH